MVQCSDIKYFLRADYKCTLAKVLGSLKWKVKSGKLGLRLQGCKYDDRKTVKVMQSCSPQSSSLNTNNFQFLTLNFQLAKAAFSLAEMMVVLLIMSIAMAAMAPIVTTKMKHDKVAAGADAVWHWDTDRQNGWFGKNAVNRAMIGQESPKKNASNEDIDLAKLIINNTNPNYAHILFKNNDTILGRLRINGTSIELNNSTQALGESNVAIGIGVLNNNTEGQWNTAIGNLALNNNTTGKTNTAIGYKALQSNTTGWWNTAIGYTALQSNTTGRWNTAMGTEALSKNTTADYNTAIGNGTLTENTTGSHNTAIGVLALNDNTTGSSNTAIGSATLVKNTTGTGNTAIGPTLSNNTTGSNNIAVGTSVLYSNTTGSGNIAIGEHALYGNTTGSRNIAIGHYVNYESADVRNTIAIGDHAIAKGNSSIAIGNGYTTHIDSESLESILDTYSAQATAEFTIAIGRSAYALGQNNIAIGHNACQNATGSNVVCIGVNSGPTSLDNTSNRIYIGTASDTVIIPGNLIVEGSSSGIDISGGDNNVNTNNNISMINSNQDLVPKINEIIDYINGLYQCHHPSILSEYNLLCLPVNSEQSSDKRLKYVGKENKSGLDKIKQLKVFNYTFKRDPQKTPHVGVIAQDLQKIFPDAVTKGPDGFLQIRMEDMFYALVNAVKELDAKVTVILNEVKDLKTQVTEILRSAQNDRKILKQVQDDNKRLQSDNKQLQKTLNQVQSDNKVLKTRLERIETKLK